jgi:hypothetical protein
MIPSSACQPWPPDQPGQAGSVVALGSYTTIRDTTGARLAVILRVSSEIGSGAPFTPSFLQTCIISAPTPAPLCQTDFHRYSARPEIMRQNTANLLQRPIKQRTTTRRPVTQTSRAASSRRGPTPALPSLARSISGCRGSGTMRTQARATGLFPSDVTTFPLTASFRIESAQTRPSGLCVATSFEFSTDIAGGVAGDRTRPSAERRLWRDQPVPKDAAAGSWTAGPL